MSTNELTSKVRLFKELQALIEEARAEAETIKNELKTYMLATGTQEMTVDVFKLRYSSVTSNRFDNASFKATHSELYAQYCKPSITMRFCIT